jgi:hypothetical protein
MQLMAGVPELQIPVPQTQSLFHPLPQQNAFPRRDARQYRTVVVGGNPAKADHSVFNNNNKSCYLELR